MRKSWMSNSNFHVDKIENYEMIERYMHEIIKVIWENMQVNDRLSHGRCAFTATTAASACHHGDSGLRSCVVLLYNKRKDGFLKLDFRTELTSKCRLKCFDSFSMTTLYGRCWVSFLEKAVSSEHDCGKGLGYTSWAARSTHDVRLPQSPGHSKNEHPRSARV